MDNVNGGLWFRCPGRCFQTEVSSHARSYRSPQGASNGLDLVLIAPTAKPPVAKAMHYEQWLRENKRKQRND